MVAVPRRQSAIDPQGPGTDFNTSFGDAIALQSNLAGYPAGTVNRHYFSNWSWGGGTAISRNDYWPATEEILNISSPASIAGDAG